jgi:hypothetical protein
MTDLDFPTGSMLTVFRAPELDPHGDGEYAESHQIGPADIAMSSVKPRKGGDNSRALGLLDVRAPADSDIRKSDRVRLPNGDMCEVSSEPNHPRNPFTGWAPFVQFSLMDVT